MTPCVNGSFLVESDFWQMALRNIANQTAINWISDKLFGQTRVPIQILWKLREISWTSLLANNEHWWFKSIRIGWFISNIYLWELFAFRRPHLQIIWNQSPINLENADLKNILFFEYKVDYFIFPSPFIPLMSPFFIF